MEGDRIMARRTLLVSLSIIAISAVSFGQASAQQIGACLTAGGLLNNVTVGGVPACSGNNTAISWNQVGPQGPKGDKGDQGDPGPGAVTRTLLDFSGVLDLELSSHASFEKLLTVGSFTKQESDTDVKLTLSAHGTVLETSASCTFELRINGVDDIGYAGTELNAATGHATVWHGSVVGADLADAFAVTTVFSAANSPFSYGTGTFDVEIWVRGVGLGAPTPPGPKCRLNNGNFPLLVVVEETF